LFSTSDSYPTGCVFFVGGFDFCAGVIIVVYFTGLVYY
jgi:hypothetical protein